MDHGLLHSKNGSNEHLGYSDVDWDRDVNDYKLTSGYVFQIGRRAVSWNEE